MFGGSAVTLGGMVVDVCSFCRHLGDFHLVFCGPAVTVGCRVLSFFFLFFFYDALRPQKPLGLLGTGCCRVAGLYLYCRHAGDFGLIL